MNTTHEDLVEHYGSFAGLDEIIAMVEATDEDAWQTGTVRSADSTRNCFFGHLFAHGEKLGGERHANILWQAFEDSWATTYVIYPVNDGTNPRYPQPTPRQRILAYLTDLREQRALPTHLSMDAEHLVLSLHNDPRPFTETDMRLLELMAANLHGHPAWDASQIEGLL